MSYDCYFCGRVTDGPCRHANPVPVKKVNVSNAPIKVDIEVTPEPSLKKSNAYYTFTAAEFIPAGSQCYLSMQDGKLYRTLREE